jgi:DNA-binding NarL/FixJ family response regulator
MRILVVERQALLRAGVAELIKLGRPDWELVQAVDLAEARRALANDCFTVCLIGGELLASHDLHELMALRIDFPTLKFIVRPDNPHRNAILACFKAGAHGCITASTSVADLLSAISCVASGAVAVPATMTDLAVPAGPGWHGTVGRGAVCLTGRQREVLSLLGEGRSTKEIARSLDLAVGTIKVHLASIFRALGVRNRVEAAIMATERHHGPVLLQHAG